MSQQLQPPKARPHVYQFCHSLLPYLAFRDPKELFGWLEKGSQAWMARNWELVNLKLEKQGHPRMEWAAQPAVKLPTALGDAWFVLPPAPVGFAECSWVAFLRYGDQGPPDRQLGYFCLELGFQADGKPYDLLCGWDAQGRHLNSGTALGSRELPWGAQSIVEWVRRPAKTA